MSELELRAIVRELCDALQAARADLPAAHAPPWVRERPWAHELHAFEVLERVDAAIANAQQHL